MRSRAPSFEGFRPPGTWGLGLKRGRGPVPTLLPSARGAGSLPLLQREGADRPIDRLSAIGGSTLWPLSASTAASLCSLSASNPGLVSSSIASFHSSERGSMCLKCMAGTLPFQFLADSVPCCGFVTFRHPYASKDTP